MAKMQKEQRRINDLVRAGEWNTKELTDQLYAYAWKVTREKIISKYEQIMEDCVQEALLAAIIAHDKYDPLKGEFTSYMRKYMIGAILRLYEKEILHLSSYYAGVRLDILKVLDRHLLEGDNLEGGRLIDVLAAETKYSRRTICTTLSMRPVR